MATSEAPPVPNDLGDLNTKIAMVIAQNEELNRCLVAQEKQAQEIIETMNQLREQNNRAANETAIDY